MLFGSAGGIVFALCVAASCFGALNATTFTSARLVYVAGREHYLPAMFGELHPKRMTPVKALVLQAVLTSVMVIVGDFGGLIMFYGVVGWSWYFVTVLAVIILRVREPRLERFYPFLSNVNVSRPYKVFITTPVIFCCSALFLLSRGIFSAPLQALFAACFMLAGIPLYYLFVVGWRSFPGLSIVPRVVF